MRQNLPHGLASHQAHSGDELGREFVSVLVQGGGLRCGPDPHEEVSIDLHPPGGEALMLGQERLLVVPPGRGHVLDDLAEDHSEGREATTQGHGLKGRSGHLSPGGGQRR